VVVVGAGIAGLLCARRLHDGGVPVVVVDKSRGVGGRMATRRLPDGGVADHGAQYFTARSPGFVDVVGQWAAAGLVAPWGPGGPGSWRGVPSMTGVAKHLAAGLDVRLGRPVVSLQTGPAPGTSPGMSPAPGAGWMVGFDDGEAVSAGAVVVTAPVPQALAMLDAGGVRLAESEARRLAAVTYDPCVAVMVVCDGDGVDDPAVGDGWWRGDGGDVDWVADNRAKGVSPLPVVTIHLSAEASLRLWDADDAEVMASAVAVATEATGWNMRPTPEATHQVMRWRYARVAEADPGPCLATSVDGAPLVVAGDAFGGARVEQAALSGLAAADAVIGAIGGVAPPR